MTANEKTKVVASAIAHVIRTREFERSSQTVWAIISEVAEHDTYGKTNLLWVKTIRERFAASKAADQAWKDAGRKWHSPEADAMLLAENKRNRWIRKVVRLALESFKHEIFLKNLETR